MMTNSAKMTKLDHVWTEMSLYKANSDVRNVKGNKK